MAKDLRTFLERMGKDCPQGLLTVKEDKGRLNPNECECTALMMHFARMNKWPTVIFENVSTLSGERWPGRIIVSELSSWANVAVTIDLDPNKMSIPEVLDTFHEKGKSPVPWKTVKRERAPVKEIVWEEREIDFLRLPSYRKDSGDARPGWFCGIAVAKDLKTGRYNCSWHRHLILGPRKSAARVNPRHLKDMMNTYRAAGYEEMPIAWVFGHHPAFLMSSAIQVAWDVDEYQFAGALLGEPLRVAPSETLGDDFLVPADAEVVVEGFLHLTEKDVNGPWSDFMLYFSPQTLEPVFRPTAITMRKNPIFSENWIGYGLMGEAASLVQIQLSLRQRFPRVMAVNRLAPYTYVVQFKPSFPGEVNRLATYTLGSFGDRMKNLIIVDEDINPFDLSKIFYSIGTRVDASTSRLQIIRDLSSNRQDPSSESNFTVGGMIIDSTKPVDKPFPEIGSPPREVMERLRLHEFLSREEIDKVPIGKE